MSRSSRISMTTLTLFNIIFKFFIGFVYLLTYYLVLRNVVLYQDVCSLLAIYSHQKASLRAPQCHNLSSRDGKMYKHQCLCQILVAGAKYLPNIILFLLKTLRCGHFFTFSGAFMIFLGGQFSRF